MGDARGHWEGDTLVVETTNFHERSVYRNANAETLKLVERFTRIAPDTVKWSVTVDDPTTWTRPWTFAMPLTMNDTEPLMHYECHEGNYGLRNILSGARADERNGISPPRSRPVWACRRSRTRRRSSRSGERLGVRLSCRRRFVRPPLICLIS